MLSNVLILTIMHTKSSILAANLFVLVEKHKFTRFLICSNQPSSKKKKRTSKSKHYTAYKASTNNCTKRIIITHRYRHGCSDKSVEPILWCSVLDHFIHCVCYYQNPLICISFLSICSLPRFYCIRLDYGHAGPL